MGVRYQYADAYYCLKADAYYCLKSVLNNRPNILRLPNRKSIRNFP
jgi:hypothetical protein